MWPENKNYKTVKHTFVVFEFDAEVNIIVLTVFLWLWVPIGPLKTPLMFLSCPSRRWVELMTM